MKYLVPLVVLLTSFSLSSIASAQQSSMNYFADGVEAFEAGSYQEALTSLYKGH